jgi:hypothetical protein
LFLRVKLWYSTRAGSGSTDTPRLVCTVNVTNAGYNFARQVKACLEQTGSAKAFHCVGGYFGAALRANSRHEFHESAPN